MIAMSALGLVRAYNTTFGIAPPKLTYK